MELAERKICGPGRSEDARPGTRIKSRTRREAVGHVWTCHIRITRTSGFHESWRESPIPENAIMQVRRIQISTHDLRKKVA